jgi:arylmalonate decarboxylase
MTGSAPHRDAPHDAPVRAPTIGLVVPFAEDRVPPEGPLMYPGMRFVPRGVGVRALTPEGFAAAFDAIAPAAAALVAQGVDAIMVAGTSLTFYRGPEAHDRLLEKLRADTGLPVSTMSQAIVEALRAVGARRIAVATAYGDDINDKLTDLLVAAGFDVGALECFNIREFGGPKKKTQAEIIALSEAALARAGGADGLLISCGGLQTLGVAQPLEDRYGVPVVSSTPAAFWAAMRLVGAAAAVPGRGRLLDQADRPAI